MEDARRALAALEGRYADLADAVVEVVVDLDAGRLPPLWSLVHLRGIYTQQTPEGEGEEGTR